MGTCAAWWLAGGRLRAEGFSDSPSLGRGVLENVPPNFLKLNLSPPAPGGAEIPATISAARQPAPARREARNRRRVINSAARRCGGSRGESAGGGQPSQPRPLQVGWAVAVGRRGAASGGCCGLSAPSGFLGGGFFEGSGGSGGEGGSREEVGAWRRSTLRFQLGPPHSRTGPQTHSLRTPPAPQAEPPSPRLGV